MLILFDPNFSADQPVYRLPIHQNTEQTPQGMLPRNDIVDIVLHIGDRIRCFSYFPCHKDTAGRLYDLYLECGTVLLREFRDFLERNHLRVSDLQTAGL